MSRKQFDWVPFSRLHIYLILLCARWKFEISRFQWRIALPFRFLLPRPFTFCTSSHICPEKRVVHIPTLFGKPPSKGVCWRYSVTRGQCCAPLSYEYTLLCSSLCLLFTRLYYNGPYNIAIDGKCECIYLLHLKCKRKKMFTFFSRLRGL